MKILKKHYKYQQYSYIFNNYKYIAFFQYNSFNQNIEETTNFLKLLKDLNINSCVIKNKILVNFLKNSKHKKNINLIQGPILILYSNEFLFTSQLFNWIKKLNFILIGFFFETKYISIKELNKNLKKNKKSEIQQILISLQNPILNVQKSFFINLLQILFIKRRV